MKLKISIAEICIEFITPYEIRVQEKFHPFQTENERSDIKVCFEECTNLPIFTEKPIFSQDNYSVFKDSESSVCRCFYNRVNENYYYACSKVFENPRGTLVLYKADEILQVNHLNGAMYHIGWEKHLLYFKRFILHASCINTSFGGVLFSGVSGIGKSTQADLWCQYENARLINGDRPIIGKAEDVWKAFGSPYAGSSNCYVNESVPINSIVFLKQGTSCSVRKLNGKEAFQKMLEQTTVNQWDAESMQMTCDLIIDLISHISVYVMTCTPGREAVECLKKVLVEDRKSGEN